MSDAALLDALDLSASVRQGYVSVHMDGDRDAEVIVSGPEEGGEVYDGDVYHFEVSGEQSGVATIGGFYVPADELEAFINNE